MGTMFCRIFITILLMISLDITGPGFVSSEELSCKDMVAMMKPGLTVVRGRDWPWVQPDVTATTQGTALAPYASGWYLVKWESGREHYYRMGYEDKCDLKIVQHNKKSTVSSTPRTTPVSTSTSTTPVSTSTSTSTTPVSTSTSTTPVSTSTSTTPVSTSTTVTTPPPESNNSTPPSPTCHQCTCSKEISESQAKTDAEAAELAKEASKLAVEAGKVSVETARVALEAATSRAKVEEAKARDAENVAEASKVVLEAAKANAKTEETERLIELETKKVALEAAKSVAKAEESRAINEFEQLQFERTRRSQTLERLRTLHKCT